MKLGEALSDLFDSGIEEDTISLLYEANKEVAVRVKTPFGMTEEVVLEEVILQGEVWGPSLASNQVDTFGKEMLEELRSIYGLIELFHMKLMLLSVSYLCILFCLQVISKTDPIFA